MRILSGKRSSLAAGMVDPDQCRDPFQNAKVCYWLFTGRGEKELSLPGPFVQAAGGRWSSLPPAILFVAAATTGTVARH